MGAVGAWKVRVCVFLVLHDHMGAKTCLFSVGQQRSLDEFGVCHYPMW